MNVVDKAALLALKAHDGHYNQHNGEPYVCHLYRVASAAQAAGEEDVIVGALWLHDSIEDGKLTYEQVEAACGQEVADIVLHMSKIKGQDNRSYYLGLRSHPKSARAKYYDLTDNFRRNHLLPEEESEKKLRMAGKYSMGLDILHDYRPGTQLVAA